MNIFHSVPKKNERKAKKEEKVECRMCKGEYRKERIFQLHTCLDSSTCFDCLASWRINDTTTLAYASNFDEWWKENQLKCPVCKTILKDLGEINPEKYSSFYSWVKNWDKATECTREDEIRRTFAAQQVGEVARLKSKVETMSYQMEADKEQLANARMDIYTLKEARRKDELEFLELKRKFKETKKELERVSKDWCNVLREKDDILVEERKFKRKLFHCLAGEFEDVARSSKKQKKEPEENSLGEFQFMFPITGISEIFDDEETQPLA